jgi:hypothetical protein
VAAHPRLLSAANGRELKGEAILVLTGGLALLTAVAGATRRGALRILLWAIGHPVRELRQVLLVVAGALPLLLLTLGFLFMTTELWDVATHLTTSELIGALALFGGLGIVFLVALALLRLDDIAKFSTCEDVRACLAEKPAHADEEHEPLDRWLGKRKVPPRLRDLLFKRQRKTRRDLRQVREADLTVGRRSWGGDRSRAERTYICRCRRRRC